MNPEKIIGTKGSDIGDIIQGEYPSKK